MMIRDRVKELRRVQAGLLRPHPKNWRVHPQDQRDALRGVLAEIGYADALLARELPDGSLQLIDGHLRAETTPDIEVPVLILDLNEQEADKLLAIHDPLTGMAQADEDLLAALAAEVETESAALHELLGQMIAGDEPDAEPQDQTVPPEVAVPESYQVVVDCEDEDQQREVFERLTGEGFKCRLLTL
jgi:hypothetical protein